MAAQNPQEERLGERLQESGNGTLVVFVLRFAQVRHDSGSCSYVYTWTVVKLSFKYLVQHTSSLYLPRFITPQGGPR